MTGEGAHKPALLEAAAALREVHRTLVQAVRATYEREIGPAGGPGQMLRLLTEHPYFAWLHPMSELIVDLDSSDAARRSRGDRKSTRLNSSHVEMSYAVFCLKKKNKRLRQFSNPIDQVHCTGS